MRIRARLSCTVAAVLVFATAGTVIAADRWAAVSDEVTAEGIRRHTVVLGSDGLAGRFPGTSGGNRAASYLVDELRRIGLASPWSHGRLQQMVPLHGSTAQPESEMVVSNLGEARRLQLGTDYLLYTGGDQTEIPRPAPTVFVGYGIVAPEFDYSDYADVDVRGRVVVYLPGEPASDDPRFFAGQRATVYSAAETKRRIALSRGAVGSFLLPMVDGAAAEAWARLRRDFAFEHMSLAYAIPSHLSGIFHPDLAGWLFSSALYDWTSVREMERTGTVRSFHLPVQLAFDGHFQSRDVMSPNVVARLEGRDPMLRDTAIVVSAHYDHLGIGPVMEGDSIYNGVIDNAIGVAGVLEIARVLAELDPPPRRSVIFLFSTAEEEGLLGSRYFLDRPPIRLSRMAANINVDGLAFNAAFDDVIGVGADLSSLGDVLAEVVSALGLEIGEVSQELWSSESFSRSDQAAFAERGVPSLLVNEGFSWRGSSRAEAERRTMWWLHSVYHSPKDDLDQKISWHAARQHTGLLAALILRLADSREDPQWHPQVPYAYERALSRALGK
jgi:hypothetical protein